MIGKAKWFKRRRYTGWGISPITWQGWVYILAGVGIAVLLQLLPISQNLKISGYLILGIVFSIDILLIMAGIKMDEMEAKIEAIAERNASWAMVTCLALEAIYFVITEATLNVKNGLFIFIAPMLVGVFVKSLSNIILDRKGV